MVMNLVSDTQGRKQAFLIAMLVTLAGIWCTKLSYFYSPVIRLIYKEYLHTYGVSVYERFWVRVHLSFVLYVVC